jgi:hypothetical protein
VLNASGSDLTGNVTGGGTFVNPIRNDTGNLVNVLYYNTSTKEVSYGPASVIGKLTLSGNVTLSANQAGTFLYSTASTNSTVTVPSNANVAFAVGTTITVVQQGSGAITLSPQAGVTMYLGGNNISTSRTVSPYGIGTLLKVDTNTWFINGTGVY